MESNSHQSAHKKELLRLLTCGSVDDGKSTLIGRLLMDTGSIPTDTLEAMERDSKVQGTVEGGIDPALLTDGLKAEREQGITIDVAHMYFSTLKRSFIIADTPGHEQYTRNMATGASNANLAVILIDARKGVLEQTRRHSFIASLLGIKHVLVAVNKMDLVDYSEQVFNDIQDAFSEFAAKLETTDLHFIPISALSGDNVVHRSENMPWYDGSTLMNLLESVHIASDRNLVDFRFPVQYVNRPTLDYRGYCGAVASGTVRPGDEVMVLPSRKTATIDKIVTSDGELDRAFAPQSVTLLLNQEVDISRGDMLVPPKNVPHTDTTFEAMIVWMSDQELDTSAEYIFKHTSKEVPGTMPVIRYQMDVNSLHRKQTNALGLNDIGRCKVQLQSPIAFDAYKRNKSTGSFIVIDKMTNATVAAGMILERAVEEEKTKNEKPKTKGLSLEEERSSISTQQREERSAHKAVSLLFTGLSGVGKSTIAYALEKKLFDMQCSVSVLDGENMRLGLNRDLGFSNDDRYENVRRTAEAAKILNQSGAIALMALVSPTEEIRNVAKQSIGEGQCIVIHLTASVDVCKERNRQELYDQAEQKTANVPGVSSSYEIPDNADLTIDTAEVGVEEAVEQIVGLLKERDFLYIQCIA